MFTVTTLSRSIVYLSLALFVFQRWVTSLSTAPQTLADKELLKTNIPSRLMETGDAEQSEESDDIYGKLDDLSDEFESYVTPRNDNGHDYVNNWDTLADGDISYRDTVGASNIAPAGVDGAELGTRAELFCEPPSGFPVPSVNWYKNNVPIVEVNEHGPTITPAGTLTFRQVTLQDMANYTCVAENIAGKRTSDSAVLIVYVNGGWSSWSPWRECKCLGKPFQGRKRTRSCTNPIPINGGSECIGPQIQKSPDCLTCPDETQIVSAEGYDMPAMKRTGRWSAWSEWSSCSSECIQIRRRKCIASTATVIIDDDDASLGINVGSLSSSNGLAASGGGGIISSSAGNSNVGNGGGGVNGKAQCSGKDIQTAECRGEHCQIGKDGELSYCLWSIRS
uniref:Ig-like domain-containing protein n=1 Tax=Glossina austeni TaxID=7395 RepID=A0A1A9V945_GLOAU